MGGVLYSLGKRKGEKGGQRRTMQENLVLAAEPARMERGLNFGSNVGGLAYATRRGEKKRLRAIAESVFPIGARKGGRSPFQSGGISLRSGGQGEGGKRRSYYVD